MDQITSIAKLVALRYYIRLPKRPTSTGAATPGRGPPLFNPLTEFWPSMTTEVMCTNSIQLLCTALAELYHTTTLAVHLHVPGSKATCPEGPNRIGRSHACKPPFNGTQKRERRIAQTERRRRTAMQGARTSRENYGLSQSTCRRGGRTRTHEPRTGRATSSHENRPNAAGNTQCTSPSVTKPRKRVIHMRTCARSKWANLEPT